MVLGTGDALTSNAVRVIDLFREFDDNGDGEISMNEFTMALPMLGIPINDTEAKELFDLFDVRRRSTHPTEAIARRIVVQRARKRPPVLPCRAMGKLARRTCDRVRSPRHAQRWCSISCG